MRSYEFTQRWLAPDLGRLWEVATVLGVRLDGSDAATLRLELPRPAHFAAGQYYLVRMRVDATPKGVEQAYSVSSSPWPPSSEIEITVRDVPGGRVSPVLTRQVGAGDQLHLPSEYGGHAATRDVANGDLDLRRRWPWRRRDRIGLLDTLGGGVDSHAHQVVLPGGEVRRPW